MSINPPYRFDPLSNLVDIKWSGDTGGHQYEGRVGVGSGTTWLFSPGFVGADFPMGAGGLQLYSLITNEQTSFIYGTWSGGFTETMPFVNEGDGAFYPDQSVTMSGTVKVKNFLGVDKGVDAPFDFSNLIFTANFGHVYYAHDLIGPGVMDDSGALEIPRFVNFRFQLIMRRTEVTA